MATYAIGDIQGCFREFEQLLAEIAFDPLRDRLWFTGDLVNRGPESLAVLRLVRSLGDRAVTVLGNHDLHLLACAWGGRKLHSKDTFKDILEASDRKLLLEWLCRRPLFHHDPNLGYVLIHAGLPPQWDIATAERCAREVESVLRSDARESFLRGMYGNEPDRWSEDLTGQERLRFITNCLTRMRFCTRKGRLDLKFKGPPGSQSDDLMPWYAVPDRASSNSRILFGHWATLHLGPANTERHNVIGLDTGCVWGGHLTAVRLEDEHLFKITSHTRAENDD